MLQFSFYDVFLLPSFLRSLASFLVSCVAMRFHLHMHLGGLVTTSVFATNLYVSSYIGTITSLQLTQSANGSYSLNTISITNGSEPNPSWLTLDPDKGLVYCVDEGLSTPNGSLASYLTSASGELTEVDRLSVISGPVSSIVYNQGKALAVAHYSGSAVTNYEISSCGGLQALQSFTFTLSAPGPNPSRQEAPHPHEALVDPTDSFILVPDLGADLVRVFSINASTSALTESTPLEAASGSGPRHGAFSVSGNNTFFFLVAELANTVTSYKLTYSDGALDFEEVFVSGIYGNRTTPVGAAAAECLLSPGGKFLLTSSRNDSLFQIDNFDTSNSTKLASDSLQSWAIDLTTGALSFTQLAPAGGLFPRQFSVNQNGTLAAVGLQSDGRVVIVERNVEDGTFGKFVAEVEVPGQVTSVIWDECTICSLYGGV